jgi:hypothetical protein
MSPTQSPNTVTSAEEMLIISAQMRIICSNAAVVAIFVIFPDHRCRRSVFSSAANLSAMAAARPRRLM